MTIESANAGINTTEQIDNLDLSSLPVEVGDMMLIVKPGGTIVPVINNFDPTILSHDISEMSEDDTNSAIQAYKFLAMLVTANCEPLTQAALEMIGDSSVVDVHKIFGSSVVLQ